MNANLQGLAAPFSPDRVSWRVGSTTERDGKTKGMALAYVDARDIMDRLDEVVGPENWQDKYRREHETTICSLSIRVDGEWITKEDGSGDTDVEAEKGALSKALVRAAVKWRIGRYLYDLKSPWVECEKRGRSTVIKESEYAKLEGILRRGALAAPAPAHRPAPLANKSAEASTPFDDEQGGDAKADYIVAIRRQIAAGADPATLIQWWNSADEKQARRDFELSQDEATDLKNVLMKRLEALSPQTAAAQ